jgi:hypothetical protein
MTIDNLSFQTDPANHDPATADVDLARTLTDLYGPCRCTPQPRHGAWTCERHAVDPGLFRRLVWAGLGY